MGLRLNSLTIYMAFSSCPGSTEASQFSKAPIGARIMYARMTYTIMP